MLKFAAVGLHGRVLLLLVAATAAAAQPPSTFDDLIPELVARIASAVPSDAQIGLTVSNDDQDQAALLQMRLTTQLAARGLRVGDATASTTIAVGCGRNLRERVCVADIRGGDRNQVATVTRPLDAASSASRSAPLALELRPLLSQQVQMLDVALIGDRLLVLDIAGVTSFEQTDGAWRALQSRPLPGSRAWPRDARGRIQVESGRLGVFLPGGSCTGRSDLLDITCSDRQQSWPIGVDNRGLEPGRNYFRGSDGAVFYNAAPLGAAANDDAIELTTTCAPAVFVVAVSRNGSDGRDVLQLSRLVDRRLVQTTSPVLLPGVLTALWPQADKTSAVVITHDVAAGRYDAFLAGISCSR